MMGEMVQRIAKNDMPRRFHHDLATGKQIRLQNAFETFFLARHTPTGAAMFGNLDVKDDS